MKQSVAAAFPNFTARLEGKIPHMYADILGLVTVGLGCLIDPVSLALNLPWKHGNGDNATNAEVMAEWNRVKHDPTLPKAGYRAAAKITQLRLTDDGISRLAIDRLVRHEGWFKKTWPAWDTFPADAQLAIHSMGWAMGAGFTTKFPSFTKCVTAQDWVGAAKNCLMRTAGNPGLVPRNKRNVALFQAAAVTTNPEMITSEAIL